MNFYEDTYLPIVSSGSGEVDESEMYSRLDEALSTLLVEEYNVDALIRLISDIERIEGELSDHFSSAENVAALCSTIEYKKSTLRERLDSINSGTTDFALLSYGASCSGSLLEISSGSEADYEAELKDLREHRRRTRAEGIGSESELPKAVKRKLDELTRDSEVESSRPKRAPTNS